MFLFNNFKSNANSKDSSCAQGNEELNAALIAYVRTFPRKELLMTHLESLGKGQHPAEVKAKLDAVLKSTEDFLYARAGGVTWNKQFELTLFTHVAQKNPWLSEHGFSSLVSFGGWLCWHEGLNAQQPGT